MEAGLQMESRGESHTGFLLHRDKQNRFAGNFAKANTENSCKNVGERKKEITDEESGSLKAH